MQETKNGHQKEQVGNVVCTLMRMKTKKSASLEMKSKGVNENELKLHECNQLSKED
jgi:hypothetical protein